jgi:DNA adenine methylase
MSYPGGKGGLFRQLINLIPAHHTYIETHLGDGAVMRNKMAAARSIGVEIDASVLARWCGTELPALELVQADATAFLETYQFRGDEFLYVDPPYVRSSRRSLRLYRNELSDREHQKLLQVLNCVGAKVMISGYGCALYDQRLSHWRRLEFGAGSHGLAHREVVWLNYEPPVVPADLRYAGHSFRERQRIKRKQQRLRQKITDLPPLEQALFLEWVTSTYDGGRRG